MAERELIIKKMDAQFESDLKMRKETSLCNKRAIDATKNLSLLQKVSENLEHFFDPSSRPGQKSRVHTRDGIGPRLRFETIRGTGYGRK